MFCGSFETPALYVLYYLCNVMYYYYFAIHNVDNKTIISIQ